MKHLLTVVTMLAIFTSINAFLSSKNSFSELFLNKSSSQSRICNIKDRPSATVLSARTTNLYNKNDIITNITNKSNENDTQFDQIEQQVSQLLDIFYLEIPEIDKENYFKNNLSFRTNVLRALHLLKNELILFQTVVANRDLSTFVQSFRSVLKKIELTEAEKGDLNVYKFPNGFTAVSNLRGLFDGVEFVH